MASGCFGRERYDHRNSVSHEIERVDAMKSCLVTFATKHFELNQKILEYSALHCGGFDEVRSWSSEELRKTQFYEKHKTVLDQKRGAGYWLWKPYIILKALQDAKEGDYVAYSDCGQTKQYLSRSIKPLLDKCSQNRGVLPGVNIPHWGNSTKWTKRDCFVLMGCDAPVYWNHCQIQASFSVFQKNSSSLNFVQEWLAGCEDQRILTDMSNACGLPDFSDFVEHRHDQSVLTLCAVKFGYDGLGSSRQQQPYTDPEKSKVMNYVLAKMGSPAGVQFGMGIYLVYQVVWSSLYRKLVRCSRFIKKHRGN